MGAGRRMRRDHSKTARGRAAGRIVGLILGLAALGGDAGAQSVDAAAGDSVRGSFYFAECRICHDLGPRARHKTGPALNAVFGRRLGGLDDFAYSLPLVLEGARGRVWDVDALDAYLTDPGGFTPDGASSFIGLQDAQARADVIAFLREEAARWSWPPAKRAPR